MEQTRASLTKKRAEVAAMFDTVASRYDLFNDVLSLGQDRAWRKATLAAVAPKPGEHILDLAAGTGTSSVPFQEAGATVVATDLSIGMLQVGRKQQPALSFVNADALQLPFPDNTFEAVTISYGLRNVEHTAEALREILRITRPGGRLVVAEFSTPTSRVLQTAYHQGVLRGFPLLAKFSSNPQAYDYLAESIREWPDQQRLAHIIAENGWRRVEWRNLSGGIVALHRAWKSV